MKTQGRRKTLTGVVVSDKMEKSVVVLVERRVLHKRFKKYITRSKKYMAHDEEQICRVGDKVLIEETRPLSKRKRWRVRSIIEKAPEA